MPIPVSVMMKNLPDKAPLLKGLKVHPENPFHFEFILDTGNASEEQLKDISTKLIKYFLASLTIPEEDLWVNLSPYEKNRIIPRFFDVTQMGRDLLAEDYILKKVTASLIYPENEAGRIFWKNVYEKASKVYGTTLIPVNTLNKVWIVPDKANVFENANSVYVVESRLKVLLEEDYLALKTQYESGFPSVKGNDIHSLGTQVVRQVVIPQLDREVNEGNDFATLRQIYSALILAMWFKEKVRKDIWGKAYLDQKKVLGIDIKDRRAKDKIWQRYVLAFRKGLFDYVKDDIDPLTNQTVPRRYFSGGANFENFRDTLRRVDDRKAIPHGIAEHAVIVDSDFSMVSDASQKKKGRRKVFNILVTRDGHMRYGSRYKPPLASSNVWLVRHGPTPMNLIKERVFQGGGSNTPLNDIDPLSLNSVEIAGKALVNKLKEDGVKEVVVLVSPQRRAQQTFDPFLRYAQEEGIVVRHDIDERLREIKLGRWETLTDAGVRDAFGESEMEIIRRYTAGDALAKTSDGESFYEFMQRVYDFLKDVEQRYQGKPVVLFGHGTFARAARILMTEATPGTPINWRSEWRLPNLGLMNLSKGDVFVLKDDKYENVDHAQRGGIDLTYSRANLSTNQRGDEIQFQFNPASVAELKESAGLTPVINRISPMIVSVETFMEIKEM